MSKDFEFKKEYDFTYWSEKYYPLKFGDIIKAGIPLDSTFDETAQSEDFRLVKNKIFDEWDGHVECIEYDIQCFCQHIGKEPMWESIIKYPKFVAGSKERTEYYKIQDKIKQLKPKKI